MKQNTKSTNRDWTALDTYLREVSELPTLSDADASELGARACKGEITAHARLVQGHLGLVVRIARHYAGFGLPLADLVSEGNIALIRAAELYNPKFGTKFTSYATAWVKQRIHRALTKGAKAVRIPVWRSQRLRKLTRLNDDLAAELGHAPTDDELAERLGLNADQLTELRGDRVNMVSLDAPVCPGHEESRTFAETIHDENATHPGSRLEHEEIIDDMMACLHDLDDRELEVLAHKHGFHPEGEVSFRELARRMGVSHEWVRRIAELAVVKVRRALESCGAIPSDERESRKAEVRARLDRISSSDRIGSLVPAR
jgi:RNA polymerase sigma factor (sigma-70 family)